MNFETDGYGPADVAREATRWREIVKKIERLLKRARSINGEGCKSSNVRKALIVARKALKK